LLRRCAARFPQPRGPFPRSRGTGRKCPAGVKGGSGRTGVMLPPLAGDDGGGDPAPRISAADGLRRRAEG
jgi:hypothetical protein